MYTEQNSVTYLNKTEIPSQNRLQFVVSAVRFHEYVWKQVLKEGGEGILGIEQLTITIVIGRVCPIFTPLLNCYSNPGAVKSSGSRWGQSIFSNIDFLPPFSLLPCLSCEVSGLASAVGFHIAHSLDVLLTFVNGLGTSGVRKNMPVSVAR